MVDGVVDEVKTEYSEDDLPLDPDLAIIPLSWKERCPKSEERRGGCSHSRHAQIATTMDVYGDAMMESKRAANSKKVVQMVLRPALREAK